MIQARKVELCPDEKPEPAPEKFRARRIVKTDRPDKVREWVMTRAEPFMSSEIREALGYKSGYVAVVLNNLERAGVIERIGTGKRRGTKPGRLPILWGRKA